MSVCVSVYLSLCVYVCPCVGTRSLKNSGSVLWKLEHVVLPENSSEEFGIEHCPIKVKVTA